MDVLTKRKKIIKGKITRLITQVDNFNNQEISISDIEVYQQEANSLDSELNKLNDEILTACPDAEFDKREQEMHEEFSRLDDLKITLRNELRKFNDDNISSNSSNKSKNTANTDNNCLKLPRIELPVFTSNYLDWISFRDLFQASVGNNKSLSECQKLQYLKLSVKGEAASLIQSIQISNENYEKAWNALSNRYENETEIINAALNKLISQPVLKHESAAGLWKLIDTTSQCIDTLKILKQPVEHWDTIIIFLLKGKLDPETLRVWTLEQTKKFPSFEDFKLFISNRAVALSSLAVRHKEKAGAHSDCSLNRNQKTSKFVHSSQIVANLCVYCKGNSHFGLFKCENFLALPVKGKWDVVKKNKLCANCLKSSQTHPIAKCRAGNCKNCSQPHNTLLCSKNSSETNSGTQAEGENTSTISSNNTIVPASQGVLLPTAIVYVQDINGTSQKCRLLIDSASQGTFIRESFVNLLKLKRNHANVSVDGISSQKVGRVTGSVQLQITSLFYKNACITTDALIIPKITCDLPQFQVDASVLNVFRQLQLADANCTQPGPIDVLLGADVFGEIMLSGRLTVPGHSLTALESIFGWVILGKTQDMSQRIVSNHASFNTVEYQLDKFWELENITEAKPYTEEETACENHFKETYSRDSTGRFVVKFPFRESNDELGSSRDIAVHRLQQIERRFTKNQSLNIQYHKFMQEYLDIGHMEIIPENEIDIPATSSFYLPHHPVPNKTGDKFRVVFDGSVKSSSGVSLNDKLIIGPQLQNDLTTLLLRFRSHKIAIIADIEKMYRQIILQDSDFQRIVWRNSPFEPVQDFRLTRIAYGTASAPYLATKCLQQLAVEEADRFPLASKAAMRDFYVDDLMSGANSLPEALELQGQLIQMLASAGFNLRKWASNSKELLESIDPDLHSSSASMSIDIDETIKTLGILWHPTSDVFIFKVNPLSPEGILTKRTLLSTIAKTFDPLGWLSPITIKHKIIMQKLWKYQLEWDEKVPPDISCEWTELTEDMVFVKDIKIPRFLSTDSNNQFQLHGFSDASEKAYAAAIYFRSVSDIGQISVQLVISKTRVAPIKIISLPRLELCAALLLTKLMDFTCKALNVPMLQTHFYSDSTIVLAWIGSHSSRWKTFVANRISKIQNLSSPTQWHHVPGNLNPADLATRGVTSSTLLTSSWLCGPKFLHQPTLVQPSTFIPPLNKPVPEERSCTVQSTATIRDSPETHPLFTKFSSLTKLKRILALCLRFVYNCRNSQSKRTGFLKTDELHDAMLVLIKLVQSSEFNNESNALQNSKPLSCRSKILSLNPFLDDSGILRVGGRLRHANIAYGHKHPILLPKRHIFINLIVRQYHINLLHAGPQLVHSCIQEQFWIIGARDVIRHFIRKCLTCSKNKASVTNQMMGDLPSARVSPAPTFLRCGVDYAGPFQLKTAKGRGSKSFKAYIALFVCFTTRAIHLELVTDLSSDAFIAALKRFISRRGKCSDIYSDCGSNFVGAKRKLLEVEKLSKSKSYNKNINQYLSDIGINWHFNVPGAPHMGGLWEAGIKSTKYHLKRVVGETKLTYEEFATLLTQIEACLNSRPITALSNDPSDLSALTPGHFIIGRSLTSIPEPDYINSKISYLNRWQIIQKMLQQFWKRWHREYLCRLQQRPKWLLPTKNFQINDLCLIKEDNMPPTKWRMCRIIQLHPGLDDKVRVVTVKTSNGIFKRNISKLSQLPI